FQFTETGVISYPAGTDQEKVMEVALEAGADDLVENEDGSFDVLTAPDAFAAVREALDGAGLVAESAEVTMRAGNTVALGLDDARSMIKLLDMLEDLDDTQNVYSNADIPEAVMAQL
ncbi:MAG: YebC/PmpR family DNA-binding transcriptional regulator, partial [Lysobacterales bacterium]